LTEYENLEYIYPKLAENLRTIRPQ